MRTYCKNPSKFMVREKTSSRKALWSNILLAHTCLSPCPNLSNQHVSVRHTKKPPAKTRCENTSSAYLSLSRTTHHKLSRSAIRHQIIDGENETPATRLHPIRGGSLDVVHALLLFQSELIQVRSVHRVSIGRAVHATLPRPRRIS